METMRQLLLEQLENVFAEPLRTLLEAEAMKDAQVKVPRPVCRPVGDCLIRLQELQRQWTAPSEAYTDAHKKWNKAKDPRGSMRPGAKMTKVYPIDRVLACRWESRFDWAPDRGRCIRCPCGF